MELFNFKGFYEIGSKTMKNTWKSLNSRSNRLWISIFLGSPSYLVFALIRNFPIAQITLYAYVEYSGLAILSFFLIFEFQNKKISWLDEVATWDNFRFRIFLELVSSLLITALVSSAAYLFLYEIIWQMGSYLPSLFMYISLVFFISLSFSAFVNAVPILEGWKRSIIHTEVLEKENIKARMEALSTQLSPHFLFNNLSILNGLIDQEPKEAKRFTTKMADVFRYIVSHKNDELVPLKEEIDFINDYNFLLETRFKEKFKIHLNITNYDFLIPPVTLQQLVENAIKHNETSYKKPLNIRIKQHENYLVIENERQVRRTPTASTRTGLQNISQRFELLSGQEVDISDDGHSFIVKLPLIEHNESSHH